MGTACASTAKKLPSPPRPADLVRVPPDDLKSNAKLGYRAGRLVQAAQYLTQNPVSLADLARLPEQEALTQLRRIPGIGGYSAGIIYGRSSVPLDVWLPGVRLNSAASGGAYAGEPAP